MAAPLDGDVRELKRRIMIFSRQMNPRQSDDRAARPADRHYDHRSLLNTRQSIRRLEGHILLSSIIPYKTTTWPMPTTSRTCGSSRRRSCSSARPAVSGSLVTTPPLDDVLAISWTGLRQPTTGLMPGFWNSTWWCGGLFWFHSPIHNSKMVLPTVKSGPPKRARTPCNFGATV